MKIGLVCFVILFCACSESVYNKQTYVSFTDNRELIGKDIVLSDSVFFTTPDILIVDSLCCIFDQSSTEHYCHIFAFPQFDYKYSLVKRGRGQNEIITPPSCVKIFAGYLYIADGVQQQILKFDLRDSTNIPIEKYNINDFINDFAIINDSVFAITSISPGEKFRIKIYNKHGIKIDSLLPLPSVYKKMSNNFSDSHIWASEIAYDSLNRQLILATGNGEVLDIVQYPGKKHHTSIGPGLKPQLDYRGQSVIIPGKIFGFKTLRCFDGKIYTLFSGTPQQDVIWDKVENVYYMQQYDEYGNPLSRYTFDRPITSFFIDKTNHKIYATDRISPYMLSVFDLP